MSVNYDNVFELPSTFDFQTTEHMITENVKALKLANAKIAKLLLMKEALEEKIIDLLKHTHEGQKTYSVGVNKITVKTEMNYTLDKRKYEVMKKKGLIQFDASSLIKESVSYSLIKSNIKETEQFGTNAEKLLLSQVITKKPAKAKVTVEANV